MLKKYAVLLCLLGVFNGFVFAQTSENCSFGTPPRSAAVSAVHGAFIFIYPRAVAPNYSGCQTLWDQRGNPAMVVRFEGGVLVSYEEFRPAEKTPVVSCRYSGSLRASGSQDCPDYENMASGFKTRSLEDDLHVPVDKDPRSER